MNAIILILAVCSFSLAKALAVDRTVLTIEKILPWEESCVVLSSKPTSPGTMAHFDTPRGIVVVQLFQHLGNKRFLAKGYSSQGKASFADLRIGARTETDAQLSWSAGHFWESLRNIYLDGDENWVKHQPKPGQTEGKVRMNEPVQIYLTKPPVDGFLCVFAVWQYGYTEVLFPNAFPGDLQKRVTAHTPSYNLTFNSAIGGAVSREALINTGFAFDRRGVVMIVVLLSKHARALWDFIPPNSGTYEYWDMEGNYHLFPGKFGPGYWNVPTQGSSISLGVDYLPADSWDVGRLFLEVE